MTLSIRKPFSGNFGISQGFGLNPSLYQKWGYAGHFGVDFLTPYGTPLLACADGKIARFGTTDGNGNFIELSHSWGTSIYLHLSSISKLSLGMPVACGTMIGTTGNTGAVIPRPTKTNPHAGSHLHFSIKVKGMSNPAYRDYVDPLIFFNS